MRWIYHVLWLGHKWRRGWAILTCRAPGCDAYLHAPWMIEDLVRHLRGKEVAK